MKSLKKLTAVFTAATMLAIGNVNTLPNNAAKIVPLNVSAADIVESGNCGAQGDNVTWTLDNEGTLVISGEGEILDYFYNPWLSHFKSIKRIIIGNGITNIGKGTFNTCTEVESIIIGESVKTIGEYAFEGCSSLKSVTIPKSVTYIGEYAFHTCNALKSVTIMNPDCDIFDAPYTFSNAYISDTAETVFNGTIYGCEGSTAQAYAEKYGRNFAVIENDTADTPIVTTSAVPAKPVTTTVKDTEYVLPDIKPENGEVLFDFGNHTVKPGDKLTVDVKIISDGQPIVGMYMKLNEDSPLELAKISSETKAFNRPVLYSIENSKWSTVTLGGELMDSPMVAEDGATVISLGYKIPEDCPDGVYEIGFDEIELVKDSFAPEYYSATKLNGFVTVDNDDSDKTLPAMKPNANLNLGNYSSVSSEEPASDEVIFDFGNYTANPGELVKVDVKISPNGNPISAIDAVLAQDDPIKLVKIGNESKAFSRPISQNPAENAWSLISLEGEKNDTPMVAEDGSVVVSLGYEVPEDCPAGKYEIGFGEKIMVFKDGTEFQYTPVKLNGFITVSGETSEEPASDEVIFDFGNYTAKPGELVKVDVKISPNGNPISAIDAVLAQDEPIKLVKIGNESKAFSRPISQNLAENAWSLISLDGEKNDTPMVAEDGSVVVSLGYEVPEDCPAGKYEIGFGEKIMVFKDGTEFQYTPVKLNGFITVTNGSAPEVDFLLGDVDADGKITASDATMTLIEAVNLNSGREMSFTDEQMKAADVNEDGILNASDAQLILAMYTSIAGGQS